MSIVLLYHSGCPDGFGAAYAFWKRFGDKAEYIPFSYYDKLPRNLKGKDVFMADVSLERRKLLGLKKTAKSLKVIDHHLSAMRKLSDLEFCKFDMNHSGAVMAWEYLFPDEEVPKLLKYIEDRDLWKWELPYAKELLAAIDSYENTFEIWDDLAEKVEDPNGFADLLKEGAVILRYNNVLKDKIKKEAHTIKIMGHEVPAINTPFFRSEIVGELAEDADFAAGYHFTGDKWQFSLRSRSDKVDVSKIAGKFPGGGGHKSSAGFSIDKLSKLNLTK